MTEEAYQKALDYLNKNSSVHGYMGWYEITVKFIARAKHVASMSILVYRYLGQNDLKSAGYWTLQHVLSGGNAISFDTIRKLRGPETCICPYGQWRPSARIHQLCYDKLHYAIVTWLHVAYRLQLPRDIRLFICSYICTS